MTLGRKIALLRKGSNMTQEALAKALGVSNQAVSKWEQDACCPDIALLPKLADLFQISLDELFNREAPRQAVPAQLPWEDDGVLRAVVYVGHALILGHKAESRIEFCYEGPALNIESRFAVTCDNVEGDIRAGGSVNCDDIHGDVHSGGSVNCDCIEGNVHAGGSVNCDEINGNIQAGGNVRCDHADCDNITAKGIVQLG